MLTIIEARALRSILARVTTPADFPTPAPADVAPGDLVQLQPLADRTFGGMLMYVAQVYSPHELRGFLLRPHRGGCRESWHRAKPTDVVRIGPTLWPDPEFARRRWCFNELRGCPLIGR